MYLVGDAHARRAEAVLALERLIAGRERLVTSVEVLAEILHRYGAIDRRDAIQPAFETLLGMVDQVFPVELANVERAKELLAAHRELSARDALHVAVMETHAVTRILTFDRGFDLVPGIERVAG
jgi:hypothetical protein